MGVSVLGLGCYVPERVVTNLDLAELVDTSDEWVRERTGIHERRFVDGDTSTSDLAAKAVAAACEDAGMALEELDAVIVGTCSPDTLFPSTACWVQHRLGIKGMPAFDIMAGCSSFLFALEVGSALIGEGRCARVAICGADIFSKIMDFTDRSTCVLFGDGAGAIVLGRGDPDSGVLASNWGSDGTLAGILGVPAGGTRLVATHQTVEKSMHCVHMKGQSVFKHAVQAMACGLQNALAEAEVAREDVDLLLPHQANIRIMDAVRSRVGIPEDRVYSILQRYGNLSAASIPVAMCEARNEGRLNRRDIVAMTAFGGGLTWAALVLRF